VERLMKEYGDAELAELLPTLVSCPKARDAGPCTRGSKYAEGLHWRRD
jgi:hypothetical protein